MTGIALSVMMAMGLSACATGPAATKTLLSGDPVALAESDQRSRGSIDTTPATSLASDAGFDEPLALQQNTLSSSRLPDLGGPLLAQTGDDASTAVAEAAAAADEEAQIAEALANPLSYLWLGFFQNDTLWFDGDILDALGEDAQVQNTTVFQPVLSLQLTEEWKTVIRPVITVNSFKTVDNINLAAGSPDEPFGIDLERETGLGDMVLWTAFSNQYEPPLIWGFGPTLMLPTASEEQLGSGKFSAGPMALAFNISKKWIFGVVAQHWWSFAGDDDITVDTSAGRVKVDRPDVNLTDIQPVIRYRVSNKTNIGMAPNWRYDWESDQLNLPIGIGVDTLIKLGPLPVKIGVEGYYYVEKDDDFGPEWQLRLLFIPVLPAPEWSRTPLF